MNLPIELSKNLSITDICFLFTEKEETKPVILTFVFFDEPCTLTLDIDCLSSSFPTYNHMEAATEVFDSFVNAVEETYWVRIAEAYESFITEEEEANE